MGEAILSDVDRISSLVEQCNKNDANGFQKTAEHRFRPHWRNRLGIGAAISGPANASRPSVRVYDAATNTLKFVIPANLLHHREGWSKLAALRQFFDQLVLRHVILLNPALSVRSERYQAIEGKTPEISVEQCRQLLRSIDTSLKDGRRHQMKRGEQYWPSSMRVPRRGNERPSARDTNGLALQSNRAT